MSEEDLDRANYIYKHSGDAPPGHTDLMLSPESIDRYLAENPPTDEEMR